jgi:hypothetical protein
MAATLWLNDAMNRRNFLKTSALTGTSVWLAESTPAAVSAGDANLIVPVVRSAATSARLPDLSPARWIWYPSGRTLQNSFFLFRREIELSSRPKRAVGWICADSRYRLEVNGDRVQWGPPPSDPRWAEADPIDLTARLQAGKNVLAATVLFFGTGDGTWPIGKPGFLFWLEVEYPDGRKERIVSDPAWQVMLCRAWQPGRAKRWYLRALQEQFDARRYPYGWSQSGFQTGREWLPAMPLNGSPNRPAISTDYYEYTLDPGQGPEDAELRPRSVPLLRETMVEGARLAESFWLSWRSSPEDYFDFQIPDAFQVSAKDCATEAAPGRWSVELDGERGAALTFEFVEQVVGWPRFAIEAPAGTIVELLVHEAHQVGGPPLLNTHFYSWTRFICREGRNEFETFDFESLRWLQLHIHGAKGRVTVSQLQVRRRQFPWPNEPRMRTDDPALQRLFDASINTLHNCAQETLVDGMARERQQYSGDGGHQLHAVHLVFGETRLPGRYLTTWSQGLTKDGYFLDCWPAYDRLARLVERQLDLSGWGPILDHGVGFNLDCWSHYLYTGDLEALREPFPRLVRFAAYLQSQVGADGLLPVEGLGIPSVWIDHVAYVRQRHKQCAFNLYAAAAMLHALTPMARAFGVTDRAEAIEAFGRSLLQAAVARFWNAERGLFVNNQPWLAEEKSPRTCDRSLATAILFDQCPGGQTQAAVRSLVECPAEMGFSYPCNAGWRLWALAKTGHAEVIIADLRQRWAPMVSVKENNTLQEDWTARHDSGQQWSHCAVAPLYIAHHGLMGLKPLEPGFRRFELRPQLGDLGETELTAFTVLGAIALRSKGRKGNREVELEVPAGGQGELVLPQSETVALQPLGGPTPSWHARFRLPPGTVTRLQLRSV